MTNQNSSEICLSAELRAGPMTCGDLAALDLAARGPTLQELAVAPVMQDWQARQGASLRQHTLAPVPALLNFLAYAFAPAPGEVSERKTHHDLGMLAANDALEEYVAWLLEMLPSENEPRAAELAWIVASEEKLQWEFPDGNRWPAMPHLTHDPHAAFCQLQCAKYQEQFRRLESYLKAKNIDRGDLEPTGCLQAAWEDLHRNFLSHRAKNRWVGQARLSPWLMRAAICNIKDEIRELMWKRKRLEELAAATAQAAASKQVERTSLRATGLAEIKKWERKRGYPPRGLLAALLTADEQNEFLRHCSSVFLDCKPAAPKQCVVLWSWNMTVTNAQADLLSQHADEPESLEGPDLQTMTLRQFAREWGVTVPAVCQWLKPGWERVRAWVHQQLK